MKTVQNIIERTKKDLFRIIEALVPDNRKVKLEVSIELTSEAGGTLTESYNHIFRNSEGVLIVGYHSYGSESLSEDPIDLFTLDALVEIAGYLERTLKETTCFGIHIGYYNDPYDIENLRVESADAIVSDWKKGEGQFVTVDNYEEFEFDFIGGKPVDANCKLSSDGKYLVKYDVPDGEVPQSEFENYPDHTCGYYIDIYQLKRKRKH